MAKRAASKKLYNVSGGLRLHDARRVLGVRIIAHTGRVNAYARCMGGKLKPLHGVATVRAAMKANVSACNGTPGGKKRTFHRKDGTT